MKIKNVTIKASPVEAMMDGLGRIINMHVYDLTFPKNYPWHKEEAGIYEKKRK